MKKLFKIISLTKYLKIIVKIDNRLNKFNILFLKYKIYCLEKRENTNKRIYISRGIFKLQYLNYVIQ